jgi:two-component system, OmpR family, manganese sensing response regulator
VAKILLAEDDIKISQLIADWLSSENYIVEVAHDGRDAKERLALGTYDLLIFDWDMPYITGIELSKQFRQSGGRTPIIMLTGKSKIDDKEVGLDSGADDYLTKPFELRELSARIRAILRRPVAIQPKVLKCRELEFDVLARELRKGGKLIEMMPREIAVLEFLMVNSNQVFSIDALQSRIWPSDSETSPYALRVHIARIRSKIEDDDHNPIIKTIRGEGYMLDGRE